MTRRNIEKRHIREDLVVAKLSEALGHDGAAFGRLSRIARSNGRQRTEASDRTTPVEDYTSGHGNLGQRAGEVRANERIVIGRKERGPRSRAGRTASHAASLT